MEEMSRDQAESLTTYLLALGYKVLGYDFTTDLHESHLRGWTHEWERDDLLTVIDTLTAAIFGT